MTAPLRIAPSSKTTRSCAPTSPRSSRSASDMTCVAAFATAEDALARAAGRQRRRAARGHQPARHERHRARPAAARAAADPSQIVMLTTFDDATSVFESLKAGANGYVLKRAALGELPGAIRDVASGGAPMTGAIARKVVQFFGQRAPGAGSGDAQRARARGARRAQPGAAVQGDRRRRWTSASTRSATTSARIYDKLHVNTRHDAVTETRSLEGAHSHMRPAYHALPRP